MDIINLTEEEINKMSVNAAFDSVNLINELKLSESLTSDEEEVINRNIEHLKIMLLKDWFLNELTEQQLTEINNCIK